MELLVEILIDLIFEGTIELSANKKVPRLIRYLLILIISLFFLAIIGVILIIGLSLYSKNKISSIIIILLSILILIASIITFKKKYLTIKEKKNSNV